MPDREGNEDVLKWNDEKISTEYPISLFWVIALGITILGLCYLTVWGMHHNDFAAFASGVIFLLLLFAFGLVYMAVETEVLGYKIDIPIEASLKTSSFWLIMGMGAWTVLGTFSSISTKNILMPRPMEVLATGVAGMPLFWKDFLTVICAPVSEEAFFLIAMPLVLMVILQKMKFSTNSALLMSTVMTMFTFGFFHVGFEGDSMFILAASLFRGLHLLLYWGSNKFRLFESFTVAPTFALGAHIANNIMTTYGFMLTGLIFLSNPLGIACLIIFAVAMYYAVYSTLEKVM